MNLYLPTGALYATSLAPKEASLRLFPHEGKLRVSDLRATAHVLSDNNKQAGITPTKLFTITDDAGLVGFADEYPQKQVSSADRFPPFCLHPGPGQTPRQLARLYGVNIEDCTGPVTTNPDREQYQIHLFDDPAGNYILPQPYASATGRRPPERR